MDVLKSGDVPALVTNLEVLNILSESLDKRKEEENEDEDVPMWRSSDDPKLRHRDYIEKSVHEYLQGTFCVNTNIEKIPKLVGMLKKPSLKLKLKKQQQQDDDNNALKRCKIEQEVTDHDEHGNENTDTVEDLSQDDDGYGLTDAETLQILNHMPTELVEIHLMMEDLSSRMEEERQKELLQLISEYVEAGYDEDAACDEEWNEDVVKEEGYEDNNSFHVDDMQH